MTSSIAIMYELFLKIAFRYLLKNKLYSFINIFELAIVLTSIVYLPFSLL